jgi:outer membrane protein assembly factor BamB
MTRSELTVGKILIAAILTLLIRPVDAVDWPQWLGAQRDGVWRESGILKSFPQGGPAKRWSTPIHGGYAGPAVADGRVFVTDFARDANRTSEVVDKTHPNTDYRRGAIAGQERLLCLNEADGKILWIQTQPTTYTHAKLYANGPRTTPLVDDDRVYTLGAEGRPSALT